jgi:GNAT superfamily N-acetyltransferase
MADIFEDKIRGEYRLTTDATRLSVDVIYGWLTAEAYWARGRSREAVQTSIENSYLYGVVVPDGATVACTRVITDLVTFGWISDVFVDAAHRGHGLGTWMVGEIANHWSEVGVSRLLLATSDAHDVYARVGFVPLAVPERFMEIDRRPNF